MAMSLAQRGRLGNYVIKDRAIKNRARYARLIECGLSRNEAKERLGLSRRTEGRYANALGLTRRFKGQALEDMRDLVRRKHIPANEARAIILASYPNPYETTGQQAA